MKGEKVSDANIHTGPDESVLYDRTSSDILKITEDKLKLKLAGLESSVRNKTEIFCYLGIAIAVFIALLTADFRDWWFASDTWKAIFVVMLIVLLFKSITTGINYFRNRQNIDAVIKDIKEGP